MVNGIIENARKSAIFAALAAGLIVTTATGSASAANVLATGGPTQVEYPGYLMVQYAGVNYLSSIGSPCGGVPAQSLDTVKIWVSLAQSALLAGKSLMIYYSDCGATHYITDIVLIK